MTVLHELLFSFEYNIFLYTRHTRIFATGAPMTNVMTTAMGDFILTAFKTFKTFYRRIIMIIEFVRSQSLFETFQTGRIHLQINVATNFER